MLFQITFLSVFRYPTILFLLLTPICQLLLQHHQSLLNLIFKIFKIIFCDFFCFSDFLAVSIASRRILRIATFADSMYLPISLTSSRRRSSVNIGITKRMTEPSFAGVIPRSDSYNAFSMSFKIDLSKESPSRHELLEL